MNEDQAKNRFIILAAVRLTGMALALVGLLGIAGKIGMPVEAAYVLFALGLFELMFLPSILVRGWKSPPQ